MGDIIELQFIEIAKRIDDPFIYIMTLLNLGFNPKIYNRLANRCWNKIHPNKKLQTPK